MKDGSVRKFTVLLEVLDEFPCLLHLGQIAPIKIEKRLIPLEPVGQAFNLCGQVSLHESAGNPFGLEREPSLTRPEPVSG